MAAQFLDELGTPDDDPGLRTAEQLVAGEADEVGARSQACACCRLVTDVHERAGAEIVDEWQVVTASDFCQFPQRGLRSKADNTESRLVHAPPHRRLRADRPF